MASAFEYDQSRFQNTTHLIEYVCRNYNDKQSDVYIPVCPFPYVNKGWNSAPDPADWDITLSDCTQTWAVNTAYETKCLVYVLASIPGTLWMLYQLHYKGALAKEKLFNDGRLGGGLTESEKIVFLGVIFGISNMILGSDINCYADRIDWRTFRTLYMGFSVAVLNHAVVILIRLWVIVADGGANKVCPLWMTYLSRIMYIGTYIVEVGFSYLENNAGKDPDTVGGMSGNMGNVKYAWTVVFSIVQSYICIRYYFKIRSIVKGEGAKLSEAQSKIMKRTRLLCLFTSVSLIFFGLARFAGMGPRWGKTYQMIPLCEDIPIGDGLWISRTLTCYFYPAMNRPKGKKGESGGQTVNFKSTAVSGNGISVASSASIAPEEAA